MDLANKDSASIFKTAKIEDLEMLDGKLQFKNDSSRSVNISELMRRNNLTELVDVHESKPSPEREKYATGAHGAQFVEVKIDPDLGIIRVTRVIEVSACGKIMNPKAFGVFPPVGRVRTFFAFHFSHGGSHCHECRSCRFAKFLPERSARQLAPVDR